MKKKIIITLFIIILIIQTIVPIKINEVLANSKVEIFDDSITLNWDYSSGGEVMPYGWFEPSNANEVKNIPLIVWLHGGGEDKAGEDQLKNAGLPGIINDKTLNGFCAYVLCPHLNNSGVESWISENAPKKLEEVIDEFIEKKGNIDEDNIILVGHSNGGRGTLYMAKNLPNKFSKFVILSGVSIQITLSELSGKTIYGYAGTGETDKDFRGVMQSLFNNDEFKDNYFELDGAEHFSSPREAFKLDNGHLRNS